MEPPFALYGELPADIWLYLATEFLPFHSVRNLTSVNSALCNLLKPLLTKIRKRCSTIPSMEDPLRKMRFIVSTPQSFSFLCDGSILVLLQMIRGMELRICGIPDHYPKTRVRMETDDHATDIAVLHSSRLEIRVLVVVSHANRLKILKLSRKSTEIPFTMESDCELSIGNTGLGPEDLYGPFTCAIDANGLVLVTSNHAVKYYSAKTGRFIGLVGEPRLKLMQLPFGVAVDHAHEGRLVVTDNLMHHVQVWSDLNHGGTRLMLIGKRGSEKGELLTPRGVDVDNRGNIFVADLRNNRIQVFDSAGKHLHKFGEKHLSGPSIVHIRDDGLVYVCDTDSITVFGSS